MKNYLNGWRVRLKFETSYRPISLLVISLHTPILRHLKNLFVNFMAVFYFLSVSTFLIYCCSFFKFSRVINCLSRNNFWEVCEWRIRLYLFISPKKWHFISLWPTWQQRIRTFLPNLLGKLQQKVMNEQFNASTFNLSYCPLYSNLTSLKTLSSSF